jgi:hypothetical protein
MMDAVRTSTTADAGYYPVCNDNGFISGWENTLWNGFAVNEKAH